MMVTTQEKTYSTGSVDPEQSQVTVLIFNEGLYDEAVFQREQSLISCQFSALNISVNQILTISE